MKRRDGAGGHAYHQQQPQKSEVKLYTLPVHPGQPHQLHPNSKTVWFF